MMMTRMGFIGARARPYYLPHRPLTSKNQLLINTNVTSAHSNILLLFNHQQQQQQQQQQFFQHKSFYSSIPTASTGNQSGNSINTSSIIDETTTKTTTQNVKYDVVLTSEQLKQRRTLLMKKLLARLVILNSTMSSKASPSKTTTATASSAINSGGSVNTTAAFNSNSSINYSTATTTTTTTPPAPPQNQMMNISTSSLLSSSPSLSSSLSVPSPTEQPLYGLPKKLKKALQKSEVEEYTEEVGEKAVVRSIIGNTLITSLKFLAYATSGSAAMLSEAFHSLIDSINQGLLYLGLKQAKQQPDSLYQYGYGRAPYFWSLVSAMGIFWMGFGLVGYHGVSQLLYPPEVMEFGLLTPLVLSISFLIDGSVLLGVLQDLKKTKPKDVSFYKFLKNQKDPMILTVLLEDMAACTGVLFAGSGIALSYLTGNPIYDSIACIGVAGLLGLVSVLLVQTNKRFLIGRAVEPEIENHIREILASRPSIEAIYAVQSQYISPTKFSYKAEIDFNGAYFAEQLIKLGYDIEFQNVKKDDLRQLLACFSEDVMRLVEKEIDDIEEEIRLYYPEAGYIELEPNANPRDHNSFLIVQRQKSKKLTERIDNA